MQILIEISEDAYNKLTQKSMLISASAIDEAVDAVKKGIVLPKGHGDLVDRDMQDDVIMRLNEDDWQITRGEYKRFDRILFEFPVVIPADKDGD
jgi:hypothetical protein